MSTDPEHQRTAETRPSRPGGRSPFLSDGERGSADWIAQAKAAMGKMEHWYANSTDDEPAQNRFNEECFSFDSLSELAVGSTRNTVVEEWVAFLSGNSAEREYPADWALQVDDLLRLRGQIDEQRNQVRKIVRERGDSLTIALADPEQVSPRTP